MLNVPGVCPASSGRRWSSLVHDARLACNRSGVQRLRHREERLCGYLHQMETNHRIDFRGGSGLQRSNLAMGNRLQGSTDCVRAGSDNRAKWVSGCAQSDARVGRREQPAFGECVCKGHRRGSTQGQDEKSGIFQG